MLITLGDLCIAFNDVSGTISSQVSNSQNNKSNLWCIDFHKYETYHYLNRGTIFVGECWGWGWGGMGGVGVGWGQLEEEAQDNIDWFRGLTSSGTP